MAINGEVPAKATIGCREYQIPGTRAFTPCTGPLPDPRLLCRAAVNPHPPVAPMWMDGALMGVLFSFPPCPWANQGR